MLSWLRSRIDLLRGTTAHSLALVADWMAGQLWLIASKFLPLANEAFRQNEIVYACIRILAESVPEPPLVAYQEDANGERTSLDRQHPLSMLIKAPNELMTEYEFWELTTIHMAIAGQSFWWKRRDNAGRLVALWPLRPDRVGPIYSDSDEPGEQVLWGWSYQQPGRGDFVPIPRRDIMSFNLPDPAGESGGIVEGFGPVQALARMIASDNEATKFVGALLANYAIPGVAINLKREVRNAEEARATKAHFRAEFGGANRGTPALLDAETTLTEIGFNLRELEFPEIREISEARICGALGVPAVLAGQRIGLRESNNRASITELREYFTETTLSNYWRRYSDQYTNDVASEFGVGIVCEFDTSRVRALAMQQQQRLTPLVEGFKSGAITVNEYRSALGLSPEATGDVRHVPTNVIEVPAVLGEPGAPPVKALPGLSGIKLLPAGKRNGNNGHTVPIKAVDPRDEAEKGLQRALEELFSKWAPALAERIKRGDTISDDDLTDGFRRVIEPRLVEAATNEGIRLAAEVGVQFDIAVVNAAAQEWAKSYTYDLVKGLTETTQKVLRGAMEKYTTLPGMTIGELQALIEPAFGVVRAEMISITEITRAYSQATNHYQRELEDSGIRTTRVFHTSHDELVCPRCLPWNGKPESMWGLEYPSGPPLHTRCRCFLTLTAAKKALEIA